jgi:uroporphyrin-III C-methyltransferase
MASDLTKATERAAIQKLAGTLGLASFEPGWVWLTGAGPGDPGLITALGLYAISAADVILYDALANDALLALARPGAELIFAGKRGGKKSCKQSDISRTLVALARKGKRVLRLKGGDPLVFGRGAEEALTLAAAGVPFRIVPGVTAGIGGLAYAGIPITHRDTGHVVTFVTGHGADGKLPDLDWASLADAGAVHGAPICRCDRRETDRGGTGVQRTGGSGRQCLAGRSSRDRHHTRRAWCGGGRKRGTSHSRYRRKCAPA